MKMINAKIIYHLIITILFVYIFVQFLTLKDSNYIYHFYTKYLMDKYCLILYISLLFILAKYDIYTTILLFILIIGPFKCSTKEYFENDITISSITLQNTQANTTQANTTQANTTKPNTTLANTILQQLTDKKVNDNLLGIDDRFKMDDIKKIEILRQIKAQINFDPYKTELSKDVIYEIYNKYFDNDVFIKLKKINDDSKQYIAEGNFKYVPENNKVDYDLVTQKNLSYNSQIGINPISDGLTNKTRQT